MNNGVLVNKSSGKVLGNKIKHLHEPLTIAIFKLSTILKVGHKFLKVD
jgi:hypothetical protein